MHRIVTILIGILIVATFVATITVLRPSTRTSPGPTPALEVASPSAGVARIVADADFRPRSTEMDSSGFADTIAMIEPWPPTASLEEVADAYREFNRAIIPRLDRSIESLRKTNRIDEAISLTIRKAAIFNARGEPGRAAETLATARAIAEADERIARECLFTIIYLQGIAAMRIGENENCVDCRGESSCILPIAPAAVHLKTEGSREAIVRFTEYLARFTDDLEVRWLLNVAHMTLGEHPAKVDPRFLLPLDRFRDSEFNIGKFSDVGHLVGVNRLNQAGGAIMDDFDGDGLLDVVTCSWDAATPMAFYRNDGKGGFEDRAESACLTSQLGGLYCVQADYDNDGNLDIFVPRGAWLPHPIRPSLLRNTGGGTFEDVTERAGLLAPANSNTASWSDYDNDGDLDLFVCRERSPSALYRNKGDGTFDEVSAQAGLIEDPADFCKGVAWIDFDNDDHPDLFLNYLRSSARLYRNRGDGTFVDIGARMGIDGPYEGFSCWAWDYDNDGFLDIFASCYERAVAGVVKGLIGEPHGMRSNRLFHNREGKSFEDATKSAGLDMVFETMGSNFADFDNDGYLDMYLATGEPSLGSLVPNRMFKNVGGTRFADITGTSRTGHLQKGHAVACGDWDRDGDLDLFVETGGAVDGDRYRNILFQNPGQSKNHWLSLRLVGKKSNRSAIGARIKIVTAGDHPRTIRRHVTSGSSFGGNPLEQHIGLGMADKAALVEVHWPTSGTTQVFREVSADQALEITELASEFRALPSKALPQPGGD